MRPFKIALRIFECRVLLRGQQPRFRKRNRKTSPINITSVQFLLVFQFVPKPYPFGGDEEDRTPDPLLAKQVLSQLSYTPMCFL